MPEIKIGKATVRQLAENEREIVINGLKFFVGLRNGRRMMSACHESKKLLNSASAHLSAHGYECKVKRTKEPGLWLLDAREKGADGKACWDKVEPVPEDPKPEDGEESKQ